MALLEVKIAEASEALAKAETAGEKRRAKERKEDLMRLRRVEQIYVSPPKCLYNTLLTFQFRRALFYLSSLAGFLFF